MKKFQELTDREAHALADQPRVTGCNHPLAGAYIALAQHHREETAHYAARDRSAIMRMAGNVAAGLVQAKPINTCFTEADLAAYPGIIAKVALAVARAIAAEVEVAPPEVKP